MTEQSRWFAVEARVDTDAAEAAVFALSESGAEGTSYSLLARPGAKPVTVSGFFDGDPDVALIEARVLEALEIYGFGDASLHSIESREVVDRDWLSEWKKHWKPTFTERFVVSPPWQEVDPEGRIVIRIEPKMAFGTGTHETTRLCLRAIETHYKPEMSFLDVGTGTGILAIAAAKISEGDAEIAGCDTDPEAVSAAFENAELNGCPGIDFRTGSIEAFSKAFDLVCANLTTDVILPILPMLLERSRKALVMSGILEVKCAKVTGELEKLGYSDVHVETEGEWVSVIVRKTG